MDDTSDIPFSSVIDALLDGDNLFPPHYLYRLSDLEQDELDALKIAWHRIPTWRRQAVMEEIEDRCREDFIHSFIDFAGFAAQDEDPKVRLLAVRTLWEYEAPDYIPLIMSLLRDDHDVDVRAAAAGALGPYVFLGEIDEIPDEQLKAIEDLLLEVLNNDLSPAVRRPALEALGFSSRNEIPPLIKKAYTETDRKWVVSALFAMGRSANDIWQPEVTAMLYHVHPDIRIEAARAAGELEVREAVPILLEMIYDPDDKVSAASIWSLSQIGGVVIQEAFEELYDELEDDEQLEYLELAMDNLSFTDGMTLRPFLDISDLDDSDMSDIYDGSDGDNF
jgi:HEAT repeat protein